MPGDARPLLRATVGPLAAIVVEHYYGRDIEERAAAYECTGPGGAQVAQELRAFVAELRESVRLRNLAQDGGRGVYGTTEVPERAGVAGSGHLLGTGQWWSVGEVATKIKKSPEWIRHLCDEGVLVATRLSTRGRPWRIDPLSVEVFLDERRIA